MAVRTAEHNTKIAESNRRRWADEKLRRDLAATLSGERSVHWKGDAAGYSAMHRRVEKVNGKPSLCEWCGTTEGKFEWASLTGSYSDIEDFVRLCISCHRTFDWAQGKYPRARKHCTSCTCGSDNP